MKKLKRNERIGALMKILSDRPNHIFTYNYFTDIFNVAKSTISEDIVIAKELVEKLELGDIETISGASGGVKYSPRISKNKIDKFLKEIASKLSDKSRLIPGGFMYMADVLYHPDTVYNIGKIFATKFADQNIDYVVTVETKGIPLALMTGKILNVPLVIIRRNTKVTEGPTVSINYLSGSTKQIQTMSLSRRAIPEGSRVLIIDDFMKAGGTAKGMQDMMKEFKAHVVGTGIMIATAQPANKVVSNYTNLLTLEGIDEDKEEIYVEPSI